MDILNSHNIVSVDLHKIIRVGSKAKNTVDPPLGGSLLSPARQRHIPFGGDKDRDAFAPAVIRLEPSHRSLPIIKAAKMARQDLQTRCRPSLSGTWVLDVTRWVVLCLFILS